MNKKSIIIFLILIIGVVVAVFILKWVFKPTESDVSSRKADIEISASELIKNYKENEDSSNSVYLNKIIVVNGTINRISEVGTGFSVYLKDAEDNSGVLCSFTDSNPDTSSLKTGEIIKIKGICSGYLLDVVLNRCSVVK